MKSISKTSAEVFEVFEVLGFFEVFARFGWVFAKAADMIYVSYFQHFDFEIAKTITYVMSPAPPFRKA